MTSEETYIQMYQTLQALNNEIDSLPGGWIEHKQLDDQSYAYHRFCENGKRCYGNHAAFDSTQQDIERRNRLRSQRTALRAEMKSLREILKKEGINSRSLIRKYNAAQKRKQAKILHDQQEQQLASHKKYSANYTIRTNRGELVASKSEMMIANTLFRWQLSYEYEKQLFLPYNIIFLPDFMIIFEGRIYYWEHLGLMDDPDYREAWHKKRAIYEANGIYETVNLILTSETKDHPLTQEQIDIIMQTYFKGAVAKLTQS